MTINYSTAIFLINDNARAIKATYEEGAAAPREIFKTFDKSIKVGDYVAVQSGTRHKLTVCKVVEVDVIIDTDSTDLVKWVAQKLDLTSYHDIQRQEDAAVEHIKLAEAQQKRDELKAKMGSYFANVKPLQLPGATADTVEAAPGFEAHAANNVA